jgi:hypothetical protein
MGVGTNLQRYFLITLNTIFIFFSAALFAAALWSEFFYRDYFDVVDGQPVLGIWKTLPHFTETVPVSIHIKFFCLLRPVLYF